MSAGSPMRTVLGRGSLFAVAYFLFAEAGSLLAVRSAHFIAFWPPSGLYLIGLLLAERRARPALVLGALVSNTAWNLVHGQPVLVSLAFSAGNSLEALAGVWLLLRFIPPPFTLGSVRTVLALAALPASLATSLGASVGALTLWMAHGSVSWATWGLWWSGDAMGVLLIGPFLLAATDPGDLWRQILAALSKTEGQAFLGGLGLLVLVLLVGPAASPLWYAILSLPFLLWCAIRYGPDLSALAMLAVGVSMAWHVVRATGFWLMSDVSVATEQARVQSALALLSVSTLLVAALFSERGVAEKLLAANRERFRSLIESAPDGIVMVDPAGTIRLVNARMETLFGHGRDAMLGQSIEMLLPQRLRAIHAQERAGFVQERGARPMGIGLALTGLHRDGHEFPLEISLSPLREGDEWVTVASVRDISERVRTARELAVKNTALLEVHHRVKNNLQIVASLLSLQAGQAADPRLGELLATSRDRIHAMAHLHEFVYRSSSFDRVAGAAYVTGLAEELLHAHASPRTTITLIKNTGDVSLSLEAAIPCGLIVNELLTNALKHAFVGRDRGEIHLDLVTDAAGTCTLRVRDNGVGLPDGFDVARIETLGWRLIVDLTRQIAGTVDVRRGAGTEVAIQFPLS